MGKKYVTVGEFVNKAKLIHGGKYDYSLVKYLNTKTKVTIICKYHDKFFQTPYHHLTGQGCPKCAGKHKTTNDFIKEASIIHDNKYDYSLVEYVKSRLKIKIICPMHGIFEQIPNTHLSGHGCYMCGTPLKTKNQFIIDAKFVHGNKYDYSLVNYKNNISKIKIICPQHGIFEQIPNSHLNGNGCPKCANKNVTTEEFINKANLTHNHKYDYSLVDYKNNNSKIKIICLQHGIFEQIPNTHLNGHGCYICGNIKIGNLCKKTREEFISESIIIHKNKYDYSLVNYINNKTKVKIICSTHGIFKQMPNSHLQGNGCYKCKQSKGEIRIEQFFCENNIEYETQKKFDGCKNKRKLQFDFYLPKQNICLEYDGLQHYSPIEFFGGETKFKISQENDKIKNDFCRENNINLIRIRYDDNVENKLKNIC